MSALKLTPYLTALKISHKLALIVFWQASYFRFGQTLKKTPINYSWHILNLNCVQDRNQKYKRREDKNIVRRHLNFFELFKLTVVNG